MKLVFNLAVVGAAVFLVAQCDSTLSAYRSLVTTSAAAASSGAPTPRVPGAIR